MMLTIDELYAKWNSISPYQEGFLLVFDDYPLSFHIGYLSDSQKCFVVLNAGKHSNLPSSKAIDVENILLTNGNYALRFLLNYPSLDEIFVKLCWDLMCVSKDASDPIAKIIDQYKKWLRLLQQIGNGLLPVHSQKGLIGELLYLSDLIDKYNEDVAINSWVGPEGCDQDYNFEIGWAEIKTTIISGTSIQVSSLQQLDRTDKGQLIVYFLDRTTSCGNNTISLDEVIAQIMSKIKLYYNKNLFAIKLAKNGYQNKDEEKYSSFRFKVAEKRIYQVDKRFPRLTKDNVSPTIIEAQYKIDLPSIDGFRLREE